MWALVHRKPIFIHVNVKQDNPRKNNQELYTPNIFQRRNIHFVLTFIVRDEPRIDCIYKYRID